MLDLHDYGLSTNASNNGHRLSRDATSEQYGAKIRQSAMKAGQQHEPLRLCLPAAKCDCTRQQHPQLCFVAPARGSKWNKTPYIGCGPRRQFSSAKICDAASCSFFALIYLGISRRRINLVW